MYMETNVPYIQPFLVALNFQTESAMMDLYLGKFRQNGNSGYILKPEYMRKGEMIPFHNL